MRSESPQVGSWLVLAATSALCVAISIPIYQWATNDADEPDVELRDYGLWLVTPDGEPVSIQRGRLKLALDPYSLYRNYPNQKAERFSIDDRGYRPTSDVAAAGGSPRIVVLGGSAAFGLILGSDKQTFPARLAQRVPEFEFINTAVVGYLSSQELSEMVHYASRFEPALYLSFGGWNDLYSAFDRTRRCTELDGVSWAFPLIERRMIEAFRHEIGDENGDLPRAEGTQDLEACFEAVGRAYVENLTRMRAFARGSGASFMVVFQPELAHKRNRSEREEEILEEWERDHRYTSDDFSGRYAHLIASAKEALDEQNVPYIDLNEETAIIDEPERLFIDAVHLNAPGSEIVARVLEPKIRAAIAGSDVSASSPTNAETGSPQR